jgi:hypothetical protein
MTMELNCSPWAELTNGTWLRTAWPTRVAAHTAARVQAVADPGEIVVTEPIMSMSFGSGLEFLPRGEQETRGVPGRWRFWSVAG